MTNESEGRPCPPAEAAPTTELAIPNSIRRDVTDSTVTAEVILRDYPEYIAYRRSQLARDLRSRRRITRELDSICGHLRNADEVVLLKAHLLQLREEEGDPGNLYVDTGNYWRDSGMTLDTRERAAAGRKLATLPVPGQRRPQDAGGAA